MTCLKCHAYIHNGMYNHSLNHANNFALIIMSLLFYGMTKASNELQAIYTYISYIHRHKQKLVESDDILGTVSQPK